ncbi:hypothetical protein [Mesorhizobium sp. M1143]|uniref:hypothetical protein n=1 Tax=Mesorhizobium sp. M1143 TaxID=2957061 RepID=UPI003339534B
MAEIEERCILEEGSQKGSQTSFQFPSKCRSASDRCSNFLSRFERAFTLRTAIQDWRRILVHGNPMVLPLSTWRSISAVGILAKRIASPDAEICA